MDGRGHPGAELVLSGGDARMHQKAALPRGFMAAEAAAAAVISSSSRRTGSSRRSRSCSLAIVVVVVEREAKFEIEAT